MQNNACNTTLRLPSVAASFGSRVFSYWEIVDVFLAPEPWTTFSEVFMLAYSPLILAKMCSPIVLQVIAQICWNTDALINFRTLLRIKLNDHAKNGTMPACAVVERIQMTSFDTWQGVKQY